MTAQEERNRPFIESRYEGETLHNKRHGKGRILI